MPKYRVLIADSVSARAAEALAASPSIEVDDRAGISVEELTADIGNYHGLVVRSRTKVTADLLQHADNLQIVGRAGVGVDNVDLVAASRKGIVVENTPGGNAVTTAEHALSLLLSLTRHIAQATASMRAGKWEKKKFSGSELLDKTLGVVGMGNIGRIVADRARGLRMKVVAYDPFMGHEAAARLGVELVDFDTLCERADFITAHTPLTDETRGILGASAMEKMKDGVLIVNAARGGIVDEQALVNALETGKVGGAALDVFETEPPPADHPLLAHPKVICTPHLGASTGEAQEKVAVQVAEQFVAFFERGEIRNAVNASSMSAEEAEKGGPWLSLSTRLGSLLGQISRAEECAETGFIDDLKVEVFGDIGGLDAKACTSAALTGVLSDFLDVPVNSVNAKILAEERGMSVSEVARSKDADLVAGIAVTAQCGKTQRYVKGTLYHVGDRVEPRVVQIDDYLIEAAPTGSIVLVRNQDTPGVIGAVGTLIGDAGVNVSGLSVGSDPQSKTAIALWNVDGAPPEDLVEKATALDAVTSVAVVEL